MSRLTFRERAGAVCYQKQTRDRYLAEGAPPVAALDLAQARVRPVTRTLAAQVIYKYEWLGTMSSTARHYGIFFGIYCAGVTCVALNGTGTAGPYVAANFGLARTQLATLARGACVHWAPPGTNSKLVAWTCRLLALEPDAPALLIAYADEDAGEIGTIYQACNWTYIGRTRPDFLLVAPSGRVLNHRLLEHEVRRRRVSKAVVRARLRAAGWHEQPALPKHRYVYILDRRHAALVAQIAAMRLPYPKRGRSAENGTAVPTAGAGVIPSRPLHTEAEA